MLGCRATAVVIALVLASLGRLAGYAVLFARTRAAVPASSFIDVGVRFVVLMALRAASDGPGARCGRCASNADLVKRLVLLGWNRLKVRRVHAAPMWAVALGRRTVASAMAGVVEVHPVWNRAVRQLVGQSMRQLSAGPDEAAVAVLVDIASEGPTFGIIATPDLCPEVRNVVATLPGDLKRIAGTEPSPIVLVAPAPQLDAYGAGAPVDRTDIVIHTDKSISPGRDTLPGGPGPCRCRCA